MLRRPLLIIVELQLIAFTWPEAIDELPLCHHGCQLELLLVECKRYRLVHVKVRIVRHIRHVLDLAARILFTHFLLLESLDALFDGKLGQVTHLRRAQLFPHFHTLTAAFRGAV